MVRNLSISNKDLLGSVSRMSSFARQVLQDVSAQAADLSSSAGRRVGVTGVRSNSSISTEQHNRGTELSDNSSYDAGPSFFSSSNSGFLDTMGNSLESLVNKWTGAGLTGEQLMQLGFEEYMSNTAYQRQVSDMQSAGVNPALLYDKGSSGATTPSAGSATNGLAFGDLVQLLLLPMQLKQMQAGINNTNAGTLANEASAREATARALNLEQDTRNKAIEESSMQLEYDFNKLIFDARKKSYDLSVEKQEVDIDVAREHKQEIIENIKLLAQQAQTEHEKKFYYQMEADLADARSTEIETLLPFHQSLLQAQANTTSKQGTMYMAAASLSTMQALQQKGLLQSGWVQKQIEEMESRIRANCNEADYKEALSQIAGVKGKLASGKAITLDDIPKWRVTDRVAAEIWNEFIQRAYEASTAITGPLAGAIAK